MRRMRWVDELCVLLCNCRSAGSVCLPWLPHVREHSVHGVQSERMQLMGQSTTQLSDSVHLLTRPSCRKSSSLVRTGCRLAWLKQLALALPVFRQWITSDQVVLVLTSLGTKLKPVCVRLISELWKWEDLLAEGASWKTGASNLWRLELRPSLRKATYPQSLHLLPAHTSTTPQPFHRCECSRGDAGGNLPHTRRSHSAGTCSSLQDTHTHTPHST